MYVRVWQFIVRPERVEEFERVYGPSGEWTTLFSSAPGFVRTELFRSATPAPEYLTLDYWDDEESFLSFHDTRNNDYQALDLRCAGLTAREELIGAINASASVSTRDLQ